MSKIQALINEIRGHMQEQCRINLRTSKNKECLSASKEYLSTGHFGICQDKKGGGE